MRLTYLPHIILSIAIFCCCSPRSKKNNEEDNPKIAGGISNQFVYDIAEDTTGQIWIGTFRGLNRYNSRDYYQYFESEDSLSLPNNQVRDILVTKGGDLYVATVSGLCRRTDMDNFRRIDLKDDEAVFGLAEMADSSIIVQCSRRLLKYDPSDNDTEVLMEDLTVGAGFWTKVHVDGDNHLWITNDNSLRRYDIDKGAVADSIPTGIYASNSFLIGDNDIWLIGSSLRRFDTKTRRMVPLPEAISDHPVLSRSGVEFVHPYGEGGLLIQTSGDGMFYYRPQTDSVIGQNETEFPVSVPDFKIKTVFTDSRQNIWFGGHDQGIAVHYHYMERFNRNKYVNSAVSGKSVVSVTIDNDNNLWMATRHGGIYVFDNSVKKLRQIPFDALAPVRTTYDEAIKNIFADSKGRIWLTLTWGEVLQGRYSGGGFVIENRYKAWGVMSVCEDSCGTIWFGSATPYVYYMREGDNGLTPLQVFDAGYCFIPGMLRYDNDHVLVAAFGHSPKLVDVHTMKMKQLPQGNKNLESALKNTRTFIPTDLYLDSDGMVWIGTVSNGLIKYNPSDSTFTAVPGTACTDISAIVEDADGSLWVSTLQGLSRYCRKNGTFEHFFERDGTGGNQFYDRAVAVDSFGNMYFGGTHGLTSFNPKDVTKPAKMPLMFQNLMVHNRIVRPGTGIIDRDLSLGPEVRLDNENNSFGISFVALDYCENPRSTYRYMMEGIDKGWVEVSGSHEAYYANVSPGSYVFKVGIVGDDSCEIRLKVTVLPPWWFSWWAICIYILIMGGIVALLVMTSMKIRAQRMAVKKARAEKERERHINDMNMRFFANISHEFRTPLTMISGPIKQLSELPALSFRERHLLSIAGTNVNRMLNLVNQLLDFNKLENDTLPLEVERIDIAVLLRQISETFSDHAAGKEIKFEINGMEENCFTTADTDKIVKIYCNLMSNALKFTPRGGTITVGLDSFQDDVLGNALKIYVRNTGTRIPPDKLDKIFERYFQLDGNTAEGSYNCGTGIGLYYARALAKLHHGRLVAIDNEDFEGAEFELVIPADANAYAPDEYKSKKSQEIRLKDVNKFVAAPSAVVEKKDEEEDTRPLILVVDDDIQVAEYMRTLLSPAYKVATRFDADSALSWLDGNVPSLIISDVVMPGKDGYELCRTIKQNLRFSHIPVILLTAKATPENQVEGLDAEADAYVTKPFEPSVLMSQIGSILRNRERAMRMINAGTTVEDVDKDVLSPQDSVFLKNLYGLMEKELTNSEIDVNEIARLMNMSRTKFYYKVKGLTGEPPSVFFKTYKLNRAVELIKEHQYTMSEISDMTGFSSLSHFSRSFKKQFGIPPSDYKG